MRERPILFSARMIRALLDGRKSQTRRLVKPQPEADEEYGGYHWPARAARSMVTTEEMTAFSPYGTRGDRLWVREAFAYSVKDPDATNEEYTEDNYDIVYRATQEHDGEWTNYDEDGKQSPVKPKWKPGIHMPRWASRITLEVAKIRVERLWSISEDDAWAEGIAELDGSLDDAAICRAAKTLGCSYEDGRATFGALWNSINGERTSLASNPWIWVVEFKLVEEAERA